MYKHVNDIYHGEGYIEISVSIKDHHRFLQKQDEKENDKNRKNKNRENTQNKLRELMVEDASGVIRMHEECKKCRGLMRDMKSINSELQEYSFTKFLEQYFYNSSIVLQNNDQVIKENYKEDDSSSSDNISEKSESN